MIRQAVSRIRDIANNLQKKEGASADGTFGKRTISLLSALIERIVTEKRMEFRAKTELEIFMEMETAAYGLFAEIDVTEFKRVISNLINNAVQAFDGPGKVWVSTASHADFAVISVHDNGKGIPKDVLPELMVRGATFGKEGGSGLGLVHARETVESWGGSIEIKSEEGLV
jgi:signal transduction histidine kinase